MGDQHLLVLEITFAVPVKTRECEQEVVRLQGSRLHSLGGSRNNKWCCTYQHQGRMTFFLFFLAIGESLNRFWGDEVDGLRFELCWQKVFAREKKGTVKGWDWQSLQATRQSGAILEHWLRAHRRGRKGGTSSKRGGDEIPHHLSRLQGPLRTKDILFSERIC